MALITFSSPMPGSYEALVLSAGVTVLTPAKYIKKGTRIKNASAAYITVEGGDVRFTVDGTTPVSGGAGHKATLAGGDMITLQGADTIKAFKATQEGGAPATLKVSYLY